MRITANTLYRDSMSSIQQTTEQLLDYQRQVASGKRIEKPSDDPTGSAVSVAERAGLATTEQYQKTADSVTSRLMIVDTALSDVITRLTAGQTAVMSGRGSTKTQNQREAAAQALEGVKEAILEDLNTSFNGVFVFAGADSQSPPYVAGAGGVVGPYQGSTQPVTIEYDDGRSATIAMDGSAIAQGTAATDIFADLDALIAAVRAGNEPAIATGMTALETAFNRVTASQTRVGVELAAIETQQVKLADQRVSTIGRISKNEDANMAEAISGMTQADAAYQAALAATSRIARASLMDYLS
jgi:flagellar hook-associated protein 3 FlgL